MKTAVLLGSTSGVIVVVGGLLGGTTGLGVALAIALGASGVAYLAGDRIALSAMAARPISEVEQPVLYRLVRELATSAHRPMPRLYMSPTVQPNALATGRSRRRAVICCTYGLVTALEESELRAVIAHELAHVHRRDTLTSTVAGGLAAVVTFAASLVWFIPIGGHHHDEDGPGLFGILAMLLLGPIAATIVQLTVSRSREYRADAEGARLCGDPLGLARALRKLEEGARSMPLPDDGRIAAASHLLIVNPFRGDGLVRLFATHPPTAERIARLERMAGYPR
jgi:heat shock protein HtpX